MLCQEPERLPRRQQGTGGGGEGAGRGRGLGRRGVAGREGGCPAANTHTAASSREGAGMIRGRLAAGKGRMDRRGARGGRVGRAPTRLPALLSSQGSVGGPWRRGQRLDSQGFAGLGSHGSAARGLPARHQEGLPEPGEAPATPSPLRRDAQPPSQGEAVEPLCPPRPPSRGAGWWVAEGGRSRPGRGGGRSHTHSHPAAGGGRRKTWVMGSVSQPAG